MPETVNITDSHCHLDSHEFAEQLPELVTRAVDAGVTRMVTICTRLGNEPRVRAIAERYAPVYYAVGTHPMHAADEPLASVDALVALAAHPKFVGIGESGLDYHYTSDSKDVQIESLRIHIEAARPTRLPLIIHARNADDGMARILAEEHKAAPFTCVMHCFSSGRALARAALDLGFYLSMSGITAFPKSIALCDIFTSAPIDHILVETDAPYLAPPPFRGKCNEPAYTVHTAKAAAGAFDMKYKYFAAQTQANFDRLFSKAAAWAPAP
ncbi:MAG: TatD family hydrolase [Paracoccaceae bacterium]